MGAGCESNDGIQRSELYCGTAQGGGTNEELVAWSSVNSAPVVAWNDEAPLNGWLDILLLLERLNPEKSLVPEDPHSRVQLFGLAHEICGELGFGWNRRLDMIHAGMKPGQAPKSLGAKHRDRIMRIFFKIPMEL